MNGEKGTDLFYALSLAVNKSVPFSPAPFSNASASANVLPDALYYYSPTAQAQLHAAKPDTYPETPPFSISSKRVTNPPGVSDADYRFYKN